MQKDNFHVRQVRVEVECSHEADKPLAKSHVDHAGKTFTNTDESWLEHAPRRLSFAKACFGRGEFEELDENIDTWRYYFEDLPLTSQQVVYAAVWYKINTRECSAVRHAVYDGIIGILPTDILSSLSRSTVPSIRIQRVYGESEIK